MSEQVRGSKRRCNDTFTVRITVTQRKTRSGAALRCDICGFKKYRETQDPGCKKSMITTNTGNINNANRGTSSSLWMRHCVLQGLGRTERTLPLRKDVKEVTVVTSGDSPGQWARGSSHEWRRGSVELGEGRRDCAPCGPRSTAGMRWGGGAIAAPGASLDWDSPQPPPGGAAEGPPAPPASSSGGWSVSGESLRIPTEERRSTGTRA